MDRLNKLEQWGQNHPFGGSILIAIAPTVILIAAHMFRLY